MLYFKSKIFESLKNRISSKTQTQNHQFQGSEDYLDKKIFAHQTVCEFTVSLSL